MVLVSQKWSVHRGLVGFGLLFGLVATPALLKPAAAQTPVERCQGVSTFTGPNTLTPFAIADSPPPSTGAFPNSTPRISLGQQALISGPPDDPTISEIVATTDENLPTPNGRRNQLWLGRTDDAFLAVNPYSLSPTYRRLNIDSDIPDSLTYEQFVAAGLTSIFGAHLPGAPFPLTAGNMFILSIWGKLGTVENVVGLPPGPHRKRVTQAAATPTGNHVIARFESGNTNDYPVEAEPAVVLDGTTMWPHSGGGFVGTDRGFFFTGADPATGAMSTWHWDPEDPAPLPLFEGTFGWVNPEGTELLATKTDGSVLLHNTTTGEEIPSVRFNSVDRDRALGVEVFFVPFQGVRSRLYDLATKSAVRTFDSGATIANDGRFVLLRDWKVYETKTGTTVPIGITDVPQVREFEQWHQPSADRLYEGPSGEYGVLVSVDEPAPPNSGRSTDRFFRIHYTSDLHCTDVDGDNVWDHLDNCDNVRNPLQENVDGDGLGSLCDQTELDGTDTDGDNVANTADNCPFTWNAGQEDWVGAGGDPDGVGDACDGERRIKIVALGDSFMSGEGAEASGQNFTEESTYSRYPYKNDCRRAETAYPIRIAQGLPVPAELIFAACSGAVSKQVVSEAQFGARPGDQGALGLAEAHEALGLGEIYGERAQIEVLKDHPDVDVVFVSIGGNDVPFSDVIFNCVNNPFSGDAGSNCASSDERQRWLGRAHDARGSVDEVLANIRQVVGDSVEIYLFTYPNPISPDHHCAAIESASYDERRFIAEELVPAINDSLRAAALHNRTWVVDLSDAWMNDPPPGGRICEGPEELRYHHGIVWEGLGGFGEGGLDNSFHPTVKGHERMAEKFLGQYGMGIDTRGLSGYVDAPMTSPSVYVRSNGVVILQGSNPMADQGVVVKAQPLAVNAERLMIGSEARLEVRSTPVQLAVDTVDSFGDVAFEVPGGLEVEPGPHDLVVVGTATNGTPVEVRSKIFVVASTPLPDDFDADGVVDSVDNCQFWPNEDQTDADSDGLGDVCDGLADTDSDQAEDSQDNCPFDANPDQSDGDDDGTGDACDDSTPPIVTGSVTPAVNPAGWSNDPTAEIEWTATDPGFSLGPETFTVANTAPLAEGIHSYASSEVCDDQGNCTSGQLEVRLDITAPTIALDAPADGTSVLQADYVPPTCDAADTLSGLDGSCTLTLSEPIETPGGIIYTAVASARDIAGNTAGASSTFTVIFDADAPVIEAAPDRPANNGWWNGPVTFTFTCHDPGSGVAECPNPVTLDTDGAQQSITVTAVDNSSNTGTLTVAGINIDSSAPLLSFSGVSSEYMVSDVITVGCDATDDLAGLDTIRCDSVAGVLAVDYSTWVGIGNGITGTFTISATAVDLAGNVATVTKAFTISVDNASLIELVQAYAGSGPGVKGLLTSLQQGAYGPFINQLNAKCCIPDNGKLFTQAEVATLTTLASHLT